jgi:hypothetical protein
MARPPLVMLALGASRLDIACPQNLWTTLCGNTPQGRQVVDSKGLAGAAQELSSIHWRMALQAPTAKAGSILYYRRPLSSQSGSGFGPSCLLTVRQARSAGPDTSLDYPPNLMKLLADAQICISSGCVQKVYPHSTAIMLAGQTCPLR